MIRTSSVNGSPEMDDELLAMAIEELTATGEEGAEWRRYTIEYIARRDPDDCGSVQVKEVIRASWPADEGEPRWKQIIRWIFNIPS